MTMPTQYNWVSGEYDDPQPDAPDNPDYAYLKSRANDLMCGSPSHFAERRANLCDAIERDYWNGYINDAERAELVDMVTP